MLIDDKELFIYIYIYSNSNLIHKLLEYRTNKFGNPNVAMITVL